jgi:hypothetical protein
MGAHTDSRVLAGKNLSDEFGAAVREALYEYGHDAYSGSIGQKSRAVFVGTLPARWTIREFASLVTAAETADYDEYCKKHNDWDRCANSNPFKDAPKRQTTPQVIELAKKFAAISREDKWGDTAAAVELNKAESKKIKEQRGLKGTQAKVWFVEALCAS